MVIGIRQGASHPGLFNRAVLVRSGAGDGLVFAAVITGALNGLEYRGADVVVCLGPAVGSHLDKIGARRTDLTSERGRRPTSQGLGRVKGQGGRRRQAAGQGGGQGQGGATTTDGRGTADGVNGAVGRAGDKAEAAANRYISGEASDLQACARVAGAIHQGRATNGTG